MNKKSKSSGGKIITLILLVIVVAAAAVIVYNFFGKSDEDLNNPTPDSNQQTDNSQNGDDSAVSDNINSSDKTDPAVTVDEPNVPDLSETAPKPVYTQQELLSLYPGAVLPLSQDAGDDYINDIYFVGDSTTHGMAYYGVLKDGKETDKVWTPRSGTLAIWNVLTEKIVLPEDDSEMTIIEAVSLKKPKKIVFTLGVNGVSSQSEDAFVSFYSDLIDGVKKASPDTVIILQSIYPVCSYYQYVNSISMEKINLANSWIAKLAYDKNCYYLNTCSVLVDESGYLNPDYCNGDGIHISPEGFEVILDYIKTHSIQQ